MEQYHPKRNRNEILDEEEKRLLLKNGNHVSIALCAGDVPYIITMSYGHDPRSRCLYFHCANKGDKLDYIRQNQNACATLIKDNGYLETKCDHDYETLIIRGKISIVTELDEKKRGLQILLEHLEKDPEPIFARNIKDERSYDSVTILRLDMESVIGKKYIA
jgi:nitroimidazol reductase NimA-like FMN-containing flavoprotein (pyridoxamine 5'-phosphate oxidase superfamily)